MEVHTNNISHTKDKATGNDGLTPLALQELLNYYQLFKDQTITKYIKLIYEGRYYFLGYLYSTLFFANMRNIDCEKLICVLK